MLKTLVLATVAATVLGSTPAIAGTITYTLDATEAALGAGPYGTVTLTQNGSNVDFVVDLAAGLKFVTTGNAGSHAFFAFNAPSGVDVTDVTSIASGSPGASFGAYAPAVAQPFGGFGFGIECTSCGNGNVASVFGPLTFTVLNSAVADFDYKSDKKNDPAYFSADVVNLGGKTGQVGATGPGVPGVSVPDGGATLMLLGGGLTLVGLLRRRVGA